MPEEVTIRPARPGELPELSTLLDLLFEIEQDFKPDTARQVAGLKLGCVHMVAVARLIRGNAVERVPELLVHVVHKS